MNLSAVNGFYDCPEYCVRSNCTGCDIFEKHKKAWEKQGLDEAAEKYKNDHPVKAYWLDGEYIEEITPIDDAFRAGAKWMANQGITVKGDTDDEYCRILEDIKKAICQIAPDSNVIVQIRKK